MLKIFIEYINNYARKGSRSSAHVHLINQIELNASLFTQSDVQNLLTLTMDFSKGYDSSWFFNRGQFVAQQVAFAENQLTHESHGHKY